MKRTDNDTTHQNSEAPTGSSSTSSGSTNALGHGLGIAEHKAESASGNHDVEQRAVSNSSQEQPESVTVLIEGGGF